MSKTKIAVIDDEINIRETLLDILSMQGYDVCTASSGKLGLQLIYQQQPDLVLCDIMMPDMDGYEVLARIREDEKLKRLPFLFISAKNDPDSIRTGMNLGSDDYLSKPFKAADLTTAIESKLKRFTEFKESLNTEIGQLQEHFRNYGFQEFNKPINSIIGIIKFLRENDHQLQSEERGLFLNSIEQSTHHFRRSYSNLILYLNILSNQPIFANNKNCSTKESEKNILDRLNINHPGITIDFNIEMARLPINCQAFDVMLYELVDNAIKHSENQKPPLVEGKIDENLRQYTLKITDHGPGLSPAGISRLLSISQMNRSLAQEEGWGLGLFLTRYLVDHAKGSFSFRSEIGSGSVVEIALPLEID